MSDSDSPDQKTKTTDQNYSINIDRLYQDWIAPIDAIRSYASVGGGTMTGILGKGDYKENLANFMKAIKIETTYQESRCHAFYRWIGLPVAGKGDLFYSPGFDITQCKSLRIELEDKFLVAKNPISGFEFTSNARENFVKDNLKLFSVPQSITASAVALSSGGTGSARAKLRKFGSPFEKNSEALKIFTDDQKYNIDINGLSGKKPVELTSYKDSGGITPDDSKLKNRVHIIKPLIVDARIDFSVTPQSRLVAIPFVPDDAHLKVSSTEKVRRPLIEKFIRDRQPLKNPIPDAGTYLDKITTYIQNEQAIKDKDLVEKMTDKDKLFKSLNDQTQFIDSLRIITAMMELLKWSEDVIRAAQGIYYWVPYVSAIGPEGGSKVQGVFLSEYVGELLTERDKKILEKHSIEVTEMNVDSARIDGASNSFEFGVKESTINISSATASGLGDNNKKNSETQSQIRFRELTDAGEALRTIEIIMGEFSGLGLCDIVAITGALKILPLENLYGLLDKKSFERMKISLAEPNLVQADFKPSITALTNLVKDFYNIMDSIYKDFAEGAVK